jgi:hypothetical protein
MCPTAPLCLLLDISGESYPPLLRRWQAHELTDGGENCGDLLVMLGELLVEPRLQLRELLGSNRELARRFAELEARLDKKLTEHDEAIAAILSAIHQLMSTPASKKRGIGFTADLEEKS